MAIIRSKIARQLLADGGVSLDDAKMMAPPGEFLAYINPKEADMLKAAGGSGIMTPMGIPSFVDFGPPGSAAQSAAFGGPSPDTGPTRDEESGFDTGDVNVGLRGGMPAFTPPGGTSDGGDDNFFDRLGRTIQKKRGDLAMSFINKSIAETMRGRLGLGKPGDINYVLDLLQNPDDRVYGLSNRERQMGEKLIDAGIRSEADIRGMTQSQFDDLFPGPNTGGGGDGDNEPIKRLRAPITEKKEEPKREFDDILKFYGARFSTGGMTGDPAQFTGEDEVTDFSQFDTGGDDEGPPKIDTGGDDNEPPTLSGGRGIDVGALQNRGLTPAEIATVFNEYYGLDTEPTTVTGPLGALGTAPGGLMGTGPSIEFGQQVTKGPGTTGTTGTKGTTGLSIDTIADKVFDAGSLGGIARDALRSAKSKEQSLRDRFGIDKADGGEVRQEYGLGSIVKKATRAVKKIAKSDLGKAALIAGFGAYGLGAGPFASGGAFAKAKGAGFLKNFLLKDAAAGFALDNISPFGAITTASLLAGAFSKQDEEDEKLPTVANTDPAFQKYLEFYGGPRRFAAEGGMMEQDEMLDLGGNEMDLRGGGFVPLGEYEKKDDVPARLSKNEFVFTADAVRAAGGGSVDRGADIMYKTMKNLENKVA